MTQSDPFDFDTPVDRRAVPALKVHPSVLGQDGQHLFAASVADMDFRAPPCVAQALQQRLDHGVYGYEAVHEGLIPALTGWMAHRHGWHIDERHILRAPNILNALAMAVNLFSDIGDRVIVQPPVFFDFYDVLEENNRTAALNPLVLRGGRYEMDFEDLERKAADPKARILILCNPHNPVGRVWSAAELRRLGEICLRNGVLVISDEIHCDLVFAGRHHVPFASLGQVFLENSITCLSPAKSFNIASCCSAFTVVADEGRRRAFQAANSRLTVNKNNAFANAAMTAAYSGGGAWLDAAMRYVEGNTALVARRMAAMPGAGLVLPEGTFLLWADFRALGMEASALQQFLRLQAGWDVTSGARFGIGGSGFVRINTACRRAVLDQALDRLEEALKGVQLPGPAGQGGG